MCISFFDYDCTNTELFSHMKLCPARFCTKSSASNLPIAPLNTKPSKNLFVSAWLHFYWTVSVQLLGLLPDQIHRWHEPSQKSVLWECKNHDKSLNWKKLSPLLVLHRTSFFTICQSQIITAYIISFTLQQTDDSGISSCQNPLHGISSNKLSYHLNSFTHLLNHF